MAVQTKKVGPDIIGVANSLNQLGVCVREMGQLKHARQLLDRCKPIQEAYRREYRAKVAVQSVQYALYRNIDCQKGGRRSIRGLTWRKDERHRCPEGMVLYLAIVVNYKVWSIL